MKPIKVFILGSCVSRDPFEFAQKGDFEVVDYCARTSFASLGAPPFVDEKILQAIESSFQRRSVRGDMEKSVFSRMKDTEFDALLIDLIDERFGIALHGTSIHTVSSEYRKGLYRPHPYQIVRADAAERLDYWNTGFAKFVDFIKSNGYEDKVVVNQVYWTFDGADSLNERYGCDYRDLMNSNLEYMYDQIRQELPKSKFISYGKDELLVDVNHKWGIEPYHYSRDVQLKQLSRLKYFFGDSVRDKASMKFVEDAKERRMYYQYTPSDNESESPLLVILHGHGFVAEPSKYKNKNLNVLAPIDNYGVENYGSWWLGENGDYFVKDLLHVLIKEMRKRGSGKLYFWGSSMGGFGALLHAILLQADAVYANIPQIKLLGSSYAEGGMKKYFAPIFGDAGGREYNDLSDLLESRFKSNALEKAPLFFIAQSRFDYKNYLEEQSLYFFQRCLALGFNIHYEVFPKKGHALMMPLSEAVSKMLSFSSD